MIPPPVYSPKANKFLSKDKLILRKAKNDLTGIGPSSQRQVVGMIPPPPYQGDLKNRKKAYVYLLQSLSKGTFYLGWTTDIKRRLDQHNNGESNYTKSRGPWKLVTYETCVTSQQAKERERQLKRSPRMLSFFKKRALQGHASGVPREVVG